MKARSRDAGRARRRTATPDTPAGWLDRLRLGEPQDLSPYRLYPVVLDSPGPAPKLLLTHQAIESGRLEVLEQGDGVVQQLLAYNKGPEPVVVLEGDTLVGCKQNRVVARSVVLGGGVKIPIPVGCMEEGRWGWRTQRFGSGSMRMTPTMRSATTREILDAKKRRGRVALNQSRLWSSVSCSLSAEGVHSDSSDYHALLEAKEREARARLEAVQARPGQVGMLFTAEGLFLGLELAGHPETWSALASRTLPSYLVDRAWAVGKEKAPEADVSSWLERLKKAHLEVGPGLGLGEEVDVEDAALAGSGLWLGGSVVHMAVFPKV
jgi:hypothetical protein